MHNYPKVSIIINTFNRGAYISDAICGVHQLNYPHIELIVVNGPSTDNTMEVLETYRGKVKIYQCDVPNLSVSRNVGIEAASGDIVAFLDDDAVPHPEWLNKIVPHYADSTVGAVGGFTVNNTGCHWQARKTICDRYGNAYSVDEVFDENIVNFPTSPFFPSLLGTNSTFRRSALQLVGGFDHTYAYLLDETDLCLRLVDANFKVLYESEALVFHQYAPSHIRTSENIPRTLYPSAVSKAYFVTKHGVLDGRNRQIKMLDQYEAEILTCNKWLFENKKILSSHYKTLDIDVEEGIKEGIKRAGLASNKKGGDLKKSSSDQPFLEIEPRKSPRVVLVSQGYPPEGDAGIARWTHMLAQGLKKLGAAVHVICRNSGQKSRVFTDGVWIHRMPISSYNSDLVAQNYVIPEGGIASWIATVYEEIKFLKTFGIDLVSFPIWDLEALPVLDDQIISSVMSLHTTYLLARPYKPEWNARVLYGNIVVDPMISAERKALLKAENILANSETIIDEIEQKYNISIKEKCRIVYHGTPDLIEGSGRSFSSNHALKKQKDVVNVLFPGRFESRKGYDLVIGLVSRLVKDKKIKFHFVGEAVTDEVEEKCLNSTHISIKELKNSVFHGVVSRKELDELYLMSDVVLVPSRFESFGLVAIEAMSAGVPMIALAQGALKEIIQDGKTGWLFKEDEFIESSIKLLTKIESDKNFIDSFSQEAYRVFREKFTDVKMVEGVLAYYKDIISPKEASRG